LVVWHFVIFSQVVLLLYVSSSIFIIINYHPPHTPNILHHDKSMFLWLLYYYYDYVHKYKQVSRDSVAEMYYCYTAKSYLPLPVKVLFYTAMACYRACYNLFSVQDILNQELHLQHSKYGLKLKSMDLRVIWGMTLVARFPLLCITFNSLIKQLQYL